jgi:hypothetical protein
VQGSWIAGRRDGGSSAARQRGGATHRKPRQTAAWTALPACGLGVLRGPADSRAPALPSRGPRPANGTGCYNSESLLGTLLAATRS